MGYESACGRYRPNTPYMFTIVTVREVISCELIYFFPV